MNFTATAFFAGVLFGSIGLGAFVYGKKTARWQPLVIGLALMIYPYFIFNTIVLYLIGALLTGALFIFRD